MNLLIISSSFLALCRCNLTMNKESPKIGEEISFSEYFESSRSFVSFARMDRNRRVDFEGWISDPGNANNDRCCCASTSRLSHLLMSEQWLFRTVQPCFLTSFGMGAPIRGNNEMEGCSQVGQELCSHRVASEAFPAIIHPPIIEFRVRKFRKGPSSLPFVEAVDTI